MTSLDFLTWHGHKRLTIVCNRDLQANPMSESLDKVFPEVFIPKNLQLGVGIFQISCLVAEIWVLPV